MAYLAEDMDRSAVGFAMGLFIAGNTLGGMGGRLSVAAIADFGGWRVGVGVIGAFSLVCSVLFALALPPQRASPPKGRAHPILPAIRLHLSDPGLRYLYMLGFLVMGAFVTTYNYIGFRLAAAPFSLSQASIGFVFVIYLVGAVVSPVAGALAGRYGRRRIIRSGDHPDAARRARDPAEQSAVDDPRRRAGDGRVLRRPLDRLELGRAQGGEGASAGERALFVLLLPRVERRRHARRLGPLAGGMARRRRIRGRRFRRWRSSSRCGSSQRAAAGASAAT